MQQHGGCKKPLPENKFVWNIMPSNYHMEEEHPSKHTVPYTLGKNSSAGATFENFWDASSQTK